MCAGVAMAVEDAAALAECLSHVTTVKDLRPALSIFERVRMDRTKRVQKTSLHGGNVLHLPDGQAQRARDVAMNQGPNEHISEEILYGLTDPKTQEWCYAYDAVEEIRQAWSTVNMHNT